MTGAARVLDEPARLGVRSSFGATRSALQHGGRAPDGDGGEDETIELIDRERAKGDSGVFGRVSIEMARAAAEERAVTQLRNRRRAAHAARPQPNRLVSMREAAELLGITGTDVVRRTRRRLRQIAEGDPSFELFQLPNLRAWYCLEVDLRRVVPQLFREHEAREARYRGALAAAIEKIANLERRLVALENERRIGDRTR